MNREIYEQLGYTVSLLLLGYLSLKDVKTKMIPAIPVCISGMAGICYFIAGRGWDLSRIIGAMVPGLFLLTGALLTGEKIGYGDGMSVLVLGFWTGEIFCGITVCLGVFLSGFFALWRLLKKSKEAIPFLPFLLAAMEVQLLYG